MRKIRLLLASAILVVASIATANAEKIDRKSVLERNNPKVTNADPLNSLSVGNGHFATTVDVTGMQSYPLNYQQGVPLCSMSDWGWHSFPNTENLRHEETEKVMDLGHGRKEVYAVEYKVDGRGKKATEYFRINPHRLNLGNVALVIKDGKGQIKEGDIKDIDQQLDLYSGVITSRFSALGKPVTVKTACMPCEDAMIYSINSHLLSSGKVSVCLSLPYPSGKHADAATDWGNEDKHASRIIKRTGKSALLEHIIDSTRYYVLIQWEGSAKLVHESTHSYALIPNGKTLNVRVEYKELQPETQGFSFAKSVTKVQKFWNSWWETGAFVDFGDCKDVRAKELERRTVLSQYLTFINCANETPAQETGLTYNSWFGRPHLEMTWWHTIDFSLWNRPEVLETMLEWYNDKAYPEAKKIAERQNFKGIRWMKMTDPWAGEAPSNVGSFLLWQQPHYIYLAEEMYRANPSDQTLKTYAEHVEQTAEFMADFAKACDRGGQYIPLTGATAMQECMRKDFSYNHPFELSYWRYGLTVAQKWRERMGKSRNADWDNIIKRLAPLPEKNGIYQAGLPSKEEPRFDEHCYSDHPAVLGAFGLIPTQGIDSIKMTHTLDAVMHNWHWETTWGWDYGMIAMTAARLGEPETALQALLIDTQKNTYLPNGHNFQTPDRLRLYLPGNGSLLTAIAMMCCGWDGCQQPLNPGFPKNGKWNVRWEGFNRMQ